MDILAVSDKSQLRSGNFSQSRSRSFSHPLTIQQSNKAITQSEIDDKAFIIQELLTTIRQDGLPLFHDLLSNYFASQDPYFCALGARFIAHLWLTSDCQIKHESPNSYRWSIIASTDLHFLQGVYLIHICSNKSEAHAFVANFNQGRVTIYCTLGGHIGFFVSYHQRNQWISALKAFDSLPVEEQGQAYAALFGFSPDMTTYLTNYGQLKVSSIRICPLLCL